MIRKGFLTQAKFNGIVFLVLICNFCSAQQQKSSPEIIGTFFKEKLENNPEYNWYDEIFLKYPVDSLSLPNINERNKSFFFKIYIGTWCSDSKHFLPKFLKVLQYLKIPHNNIELIGVGRSKLKPKNRIKDDRIKYVPTAIIIQDGVEINRIVEFTNKSIEEDLFDIIFNNEYVPFRLPK